MMSPLWQRAAMRPWPWLVVFTTMAMAAMWFAVQATPAAGSILSGGLATLALVVGLVPWQLSTVPRLTVLVAILLPVVLAAASVQVWPWAEVVFLVCWMWLSEMLQRWRRRSAVTPVTLPAATWCPVEPILVPLRMRTLSGPLSLVAYGVVFVAVAVWCGGAWCGAALIAVGLLLVIHETGQVRRSIIAIACGMVIVRGLLPPVSGMTWLMWLPLAVPVMRAGGVTTVCLFPGAVFVAWLSYPIEPIRSIAAVLVALTITGWVWDIVQFPVCPAWRILPPSWRWFTWAKLAWDPVYHLLQMDTRPWGRVLDLGCGTGLGGVITARRRDVQQWRGVDLDARKIAIARRVLAATPGTVGWQTLVARVPFGVEIEVADTLLALDILHYWSFTEQASLLVWMRSLLAPQGRLWLREGTTDTAGAAQIHRGEWFTTRIGLNPASALYFRHTAEWESAFFVAGFTIVSRQSAGAANYLWCLAAADS